MIVNQLIPFQTRSKVSLCTVISMLSAVKPMIDRQSLPGITKLKVGQPFTLSVKFRGEPTPLPTWTVKDKVHIYIMSSTLSFSTFAMFVVRYNLKVNYVVNVGLVL